MSHLFHHPEDANDASITRPQATKERKAKISVRPQQGSSVGWGIRIVVGLVLRTLWLSCLALFLVGNLVLGICWAISIHHLQGAFEVAAYGHVDGMSSRMTVC